MNINPIKAIYKFNKEAGLLDKPYSDERECAYPIEEALEGFDTTELAYELEIDTISTPKDLSRKIIDLTINKEGLTDVERLDKHLDIIVFSFGSLFKLGLSPQQSMRALNIVMEANMQKLKNKRVDDHGKLMKDKSTFIGPEKELQKILDEIDD